MESKYVTNMEIDLDNESKHYVVGDRVTGSLKFASTGGVLASGVRISLVCVGEANWTEDVPLASGALMYHNNRKFLDIPFDMNKSAHEKTLDVHTFPFDIKIPDEGLPSSFEDTHAWIHYNVEAAIDEPDSDEVNTIKTRITVDSPMRHNLKVFVNGHADKTLSVFPNMGSGSIAFYVSLSRKGYLPGETIEVLCYVANKSTAEVTPRATLYQTRVYQCGVSHKAVDRVLTEHIIGNKMASNANNTDIIHIPIPKDVSLSIKSDVISVKYVVHVTLDIPHAVDLSINLPIIVTTQSALDRNLG
jgi:sporulation-control protein spo0M